MNILDICYETTLDGKIVEISPSIELQANYKRNELIGKSLFDIYSNPADREAFIKVLIKEKQISDYEIFLNRKDGSKICVALSTTLVTDESGQPVLHPHDKGGYFDYSTDLAIAVRKDMMSALQDLGIVVEAGHHVNRVIPGRVVVERVKVWVPGHWERL